MTSKPEDAEPASRVGSETIRTEFDFFSLPRPVQDRFVQSSVGAGVPAPLLFDAATRSPPLWLLGAALAGALGLVGISRIGFGNLQHTWAIQPIWLGVVYAAFAALVALSAYGLVRWSRRGRGYPYPLGVYLFPFGVVQANSGQLRIKLASELTSVTKQGNKLRLQLKSGEAFAFPSPPGVSPKEFHDSLKDYAEQFKSAFEARNRRALALLDPLRDNGYSNPLSSAASIRPEARKYGSWGVLIAVCGLMFGAGWFLARNRLADQALLRRAAAQNSAEAYRLYLERGGGRPEVKQTLLPHSELAAARGSLSKVEALAGTESGQKLAPEVDAALRDELIAELKSVREKGTLAAIEQFKQEHPSHSRITAELDEARHTIYLAALRRFKEQRPDSNAFGVFEQLLRYAEAHGPTVAIQFRRSLTSSSERADSAIKKSGYYTGSQALPSRYFDTAHAEARETQFGSQLAARLSEGFSPELLKFELLPGDEGSGPRPEVKQPTLFISYSTNMSGGFTTNRPRGVYVGLGVTFQGAVMLPAASVLHEFKDSSWLPPDVNDISRNMLTPAQVYENNARLAMQRFCDRYSARLLGASK